MKNNKMNWDRRTKESFGWKNGRIDRKIESKWECDQGYTTGVNDEDLVNCPVCSDKFSAAYLHEHIAKKHPGCGFYDPLFFYDEKNKNQPRPFAGNQINEIEELFKPDASDSLTQSIILELTYRSTNASKTLGQDVLNNFFKKKRVGFFVQFAESKFHIFKTKTNLREYCCSTFEDVLEWFKKGFRKQSFEISQTSPIPLSDKKLEGYEQKEKFIQPDQKITSKISSISSFTKKDLDSASLKITADSLLALDNSPLEDGLRLKIEPSNQGYYDLSMKNPDYGSFLCRCFKVEIAFLVANHFIQNSIKPKVSEHEMLNFLRHFEQNHSSASQGVRIEKLPNGNYDVFTISEPTSTTVCKNASADVAMMVLKFLSR